MSKDLKIGMIIGVVLLIAATLAISFLTEGSLTERLKEKFGKQSSPPPDDNDDTEQNTTSANNTNKSTETIHIVKEGETIKDIAKKYYGNEMMINKIVDENTDIPDDYKLKAGMKLKIPK